MISGGDLISSSVFSAYLWSLRKLPHSRHIKRRDHKGRIYEATIDVKNFLSTLSS